MAPSSGQRPSAAAVSYLVHHVALPPKLPQSDDFTAEHERCLLKTTLRALHDLKASVTSKHQKTATYAIATIENLQRSQDNEGNISALALRKLLDELASGKNKGAIPLEIKAQNAGVLISSKNDQINFEVFELSPNNQSSMSKGRLIRSFPGLAASVPISKLQEEGLQATLADTISKLSTQVAPGFQPKALKAGRDHDEDRDTTHPGMVTDHLLHVIAALGSPTSVDRITKHTREEILWNNCKDPWRRSPIWLVIRVTLQLLFTRQGRPLSIGDDLYKAFVVQILSLILKHATSYWQSLGSDPIHAINAKMIRRLRKLETLSQLGCVHLSWLESVRTDMIDAFNLMNDKWKCEVDSTGANLNTSQLRSMRPEDALDMHLPELDAFLADVQARTTAPSCSDFQPSLAYPTFSRSRLPENFNATGDYQYFRLAALESWVEDHLQSWIETHRNEQATCEQLYHVIKSYHNIASAVYKGIPTSMSIMYLTILELWVACDRSACSLFDLLPKYDPEIRLVEFQCLTLPLRSQMRRLQVVELCAHSRERSTSNKVSLYRDFGNASSFAVKHFDRDIHLQNLLTKIENDAATKRAQKCKELADLKVQYEGLMAQHNAAECEFVTIVYNALHGYTRSVHSKHCKKCSLKGRADGLDIQIYEWPLSPQKPVAKATVFELGIPKPYSAWRDASTFIITNVLGRGSKRLEKPQNSYTLSGHRDLSHMLDSGYYTRRVVPLSSVKPHSATHRKKKKSVPNLQDNDVCLQNALQYRYYDTTQGAWTAVQEPSGNLPQECTYRMPDRSKVLERYLHKPPSAPDGIPPNEVVATLSDCPSHFSIEELKAFGGLPLGGHIFYSNILTQLAIPTLDFSKVETQCLVSQTVTQVGISNNEVERTSHQILKDPTFGSTMIANLEVAMQRVEENWESWRAVATFVQLACRVLGLTQTPEIRQRCLQFLHKAREISITWLRRLKSRAASSTNDEQRTELFSRATEIALLGTTTLDVENEFVSNVLQQQDAISSLLQFSITIQENVNLALNAGSFQKAALQAWRSLMYRIFPKLRNAVLQDCAGLNQAVLATWAAFQPARDSTWMKLDNPYEHWLRIASGKLSVHLNILTAELLVDGLPLARLPSEYLAHSMYKPLFSASALEVVPTDEPGLKFSAKTTYYDYKLHFGMAGEDMLVVAYGNGRKLELIPARVFRDRLPTAFVASYIHWYDHETESIMFRPRGRPWDCTGIDQWQLQRHGSTWRLHKHSQTLLDMKSNNAQTISSLFESVEETPHIHVFRDKLSRSIEIELPRLQLDFRIVAGDDQIQSRQYRGMALDNDQRIGTLIGLSSKLVLRRAKAATERIVLIPEGPVNYRRTLSHHVSVTVGRHEETTVHAYQLDPTLGRVLDSGAMQSKLFLCYLHALTSHDLPDPLVGSTGTEAALTILRSSAIRSFEALTPENVRLLNQIAMLSPQRAFYPAHMRVMQTVHWDNNVPFHSQHGGFQILVKDIFSHEKKMALFRPHDVFATLNRNETAWMTAIDPDLHERASIRSSTFHVAGFGAEHFKIDLDMTYSARDRSKDSARGRRAFLAASMVISEQAALDQPIPKLGVLQDHFKNATVTGLQSADHHPNLHYDSKWLGSPSTLMQDYWLTLHRSLATSSTAQNEFDVMMWLSTMAYASEADMDVIRTLVAFYRMPELASIEIPTKPQYRLSQGSDFKIHEVRNAAQRVTESYESSTEARMPKNGSETDQQHLSRIEAVFQSNKENAVQNFVTFLRDQWPCEQPSKPASATMSKYVNIDDAMDHIKATFQSWYNNREFERYMSSVSAALEDLPVVGITISRFDALPSSEKLSLDPASRYCNPGTIFASNPLTISCDTQDLQNLISPQEPKLPAGLTEPIATEVGVRTRLQQFCKTLGACATTACEQRYVDSLRASCDSLHDQEDRVHVENILVDDCTQNSLQEYLQECETYLTELSVRLKEVFETGDTHSSAIASSVQQSPRLSPVFWLSQLNQDRYDSLPESWQAVMVKFGMAITDLHRAQRLFALCDKPVELSEELQHVGHTNWNPREFPETLLLEAESGILVRQVQTMIAEKMMQPPGAQNTVMQLNMGEGKSSTIVPIVAAALADRKKLVRVVVAKPQSKQMLQMLIAKLGGLLNRRIYHMPFSRDLRLDVSDARSIRDMYQECMDCRGILLIQPEHILSFKLMGIECLLTERSETATVLLGTQQWFDNVSRDIVDESDENFSVKFELIYTMGSQRSIGFAPDRWSLIQEVMALLPKLATQVKEKMPFSIEVQHGHGGKYPRVRILRDDGAEALLALLTSNIIRTGLAGFPICNQPQGIQEAVMQYISTPNLTAKQVHAVEESRFWTPATEEPLLLVRGLIAGGVLRFSLTQKRWRVNYGLDSTRTPSTKLVVPYKAKDSPSPRSEFSHPDVVILLTLLSYYYGGLDDDELFDSFIHLLKSDQANIHYDEWVQSAPDLPAAFRQLSGVSIKDRVLCVEQIFPHLRYSRAAINYYLTFLVYPKAMKEFPSKLSASGWDLGAVKTHPTTGFSGTNDTMHVLPLAVKHLDLPSQSHTNALVLGYLLQPETSVEKLLPQSEGTDAEGLLTVINGMQPEVRVVLDVGALILEMNNTEVAQCWLRMCQDNHTEAVVFFRDEELSILDRTGRIESFQTSPYAKQLDRCLIYLDEAHTRGIDLKLPRDYRAAVTLGANLTKDRLVQACMRLRKLGKGQSVVFMVPQEIDTKIRERMHKHVDSSITVVDVLCWSIGETWLDLSRSMPLWAVQGHRYETHKHLLDGANTTCSQAEGFLEDEAQSIKHRYAPITDSSGQFSGWDSSNSILKQIEDRCCEFEAMGFNSATLQEEQERELSPEIEEERQIERPPKMIAEKHYLHPDITHIARTGQLPSKSSALKPAFRALNLTSAARGYDLTQFPTQLLVTKDFMLTVKIPAGSNKGDFVADAYQRPVQWIMSVRDPAALDLVKYLVILSPYEANELLLTIDKHKRVTLHLFAPRFNASFAPLDELKLFNVGRDFEAVRVSQSLTLQLNFFAGSLYLRSFAEYEVLCDSLGLLRGTAGPHQHVFADGFIDPPSGSWRLKTSPVQFLRGLLMKVRKEGEGVEKTHMGRILGGVRLEESDFEDDN